MDNCSNSVIAAPTSGNSSPLSSLSRSPTPVLGLQVAQAALEVTENDDSEGNGDIHHENDTRPEAEKQDAESVSEQNFDDHRADEQITNGATPEADSTPLAADNHPGYPTISAYVIARKEIIDGEEVIEHVIDYYDDMDEEFSVINQDGDVDVNENGAASTPVTEKDGSTPTDSQDVVTDAEVDIQPTILREEHVSKSLSSEPIFANPAKLLSKAKPSNKNFGFKKLTTVEEFTEYLANPQDMSFDELYFRASQTANVLKTIQDEYDRLDYLTKEDDVWQKTQVAEAKLAAKLEEEEKLRDEEPELIKILAKYEDALKQREKGWKQSLADFQKDGLSAETQPETWERLMKLRNDTKLRADITEKMIRARQADAGSVRNLVEVPLPKLTAEDLKNPKVKKRDYLEPPIKWNDRKQMDAYGLPYSAAEARVGNQELRDRNAVDENGDALYENGRPRRNRAKRTIYDSQPSKDPSPEAPEVLPAKRKRTARNPDDADGFGGDVNSGAQTPAPRVFKSGKRVGRPPKSLIKSKLNEAHVPPVSANAEEEDPSQSADEEEPVEKQRGARSQVLESSQEIDLIDSATALVEQTLSEQGPAATTSKGTAASGKKPKGKGGRPKRQQEVYENVSEPEEVPVIKTRGGRPKRKLAPKALSDPFVEDDDVLQSTEQDDQSRFASASTSRPTTASTRQTRSTLGSRSISRPQENGAVGEQTPDNEVTGVSTRRRGGKRKFNGTEGPGNDDADDLQLIAAPPKRRKFSTKKQPPPTSEEPVEFAEESRPKRKRQATVADSIEVLRPEPQDDADEDEVPQKGRRRARNVSSKAKVVKLETESDFDDEDELVPRKKARIAARKGKSATTSSIARDDDEAVGEASDESDDDDLKSEPDTKKGRTPAKKVRAKKTATRKPKTKGDGDDVEEMDMDPEAFKELQRKKAQKSAKLSASAKARWAKGLMKGPMEKRAATNAAKKAAKEAGSGSITGTRGASVAATANGDGQATASQRSLAQVPAQPPAFSQGVFQAAPQPPAQGSESAATTSASAVPTRKTKRPRKPTLKTNTSMGMDGAADDERRMSTAYEQFQALSSPGSPMILGKRHRKTLFNVQDDDDDSDWP